MFTGTDCSDYTYQQDDHLSYHSDQGPFNNSSVQSANATIKTKNILSCMQLIQQQLKEEDIQHINQMENENTAIDFQHQYDTFNNKSKQSYLNAASLENQYNESNIQSTGQFAKNEQRSSLQIAQDKIQSVRSIKDYLKSNLNDTDLNEDTSSSERQQLQINQSSNTDQFEDADEEDIMRKIQDMVEHYKSMSQMEKSQESEEIFQNFLERTQFYQMQKQINLQKKRMIKQQEENSLQKKNMMSKKSRQIVEKSTGDQFKTSIGDRSHIILEKKEYEKIQHQAAVRYLETQDCSFKPLLNPNSMKLVKQDKQRSYEQYYEDMLQWQRQTQQNKAQIQIAINLEKERKENEEKKKLQVGPQIDPNSVKIFEKKNQNGDFLQRLEVDIDKRQLKKKQLELNNQPTFQPLIYENIRSPALINQMRNEQTNYRLQKVKDEQNTWNQFTSPVSIKSKKQNTSFTVSDNKQVGFNNFENYESNVNFSENASTTPLREQSNKAFMQVATSSNKQQKNLNNNNSFSSQNISAKKVVNNNLNSNLQTQNDFTNLSEAKKNQYNSSNKYNSNSTKFTSIRSNQKEPSSNKNKKPSIQLSSNQEFSYSPFESNPYIDDDSINMSSKNQMDQKIQSDKIEKEQFDSFIQQNLQKLKSTLNKQN